MNPTLVLFLIEAGVRLGRKINEVLVDETAQRPLVMPLGDLFGSVTEAEAMRFFHVENRPLIEPGGSCAAFKDDRARLVQVYRTLRGLENHVLLGTGDIAARRAAILREMGALDQYSEKFKANHPARRILGTIVEVGVDYFAANPHAMGRDSAARKIVHAFVSELDETDFAEGSGRLILGDLLGSALQAVGENTALIGDDRRLAVMLGGVIGAVSTDLKAAVEAGTEVARQQLFRRIGAQLLRGAAEAFVGEIALFMPNDGTARTMVRDTLLQVLRGIEGREDVFTNETMGLVVKSALRVTAENADALTNTRILEDLIAGVSTVLGNSRWGRLFSTATAGAVLHQVLEVTRESFETLIDPDRPQAKLLARALEAMAASLSSQLAGGGSIQDLLSRRQVLELTRVVLHEVARNPEWLIGIQDVDPKKTVLAQVIASVAKALGDEPSLVTNGEGFIQLTQVALGVALKNVDDLIDTSKPSPTSNLLYRVIREVVTTLTAEKDPRRLLTREVFLDVIGRVLPVASANVAILSVKPDLIGDSIAAAMGLARGDLAGRINGATLAPLIEALILEVIWDDLDLGDRERLISVALEALRAA